MKKLLVLAVCCLTSVGAFAYSNESEDQTMMVIAVICSILGIILFFKVWGMTNNISDIKQAYLDGGSMKNEKEFAEYIRKNLLLGNKEEAKITLLKKFCYNINTSYEKIKYNTKSEEKDGIMGMSIVPEVEALERQLRKIGETVPEHIKALSTYGDFFGIFEESDLKVENK